MYEIEAAALWLSFGIGELPMKKLFSSPGNVLSKTSRKKKVISQEEQSINEQKKSFVSLESYGTVQYNNVVHTFPLSDHNTK